MALVPVAITVASCPVFDALHLMYVTDVRCVVRFCQWIISVHNVTVSVWLTAELLVACWWQTLSFNLSPCLPVLCHFSWPVNIRVTQLSTSKFTSCQPIPIWAVIIDRRIKGKFIRTVLCHSYTKSYAHFYLRGELGCWFRFFLFFFLTTTSCLL